MNLCKKCGFEVGGVLCQHKTRTPHVIPKHQLTEERPYEFFAEASELGFPVGKWPEVIQTSSPTGNGNEFLLVRLKDQAGHYQQSLGCCRITVFND